MRWTRKGLLTMVEGEVNQMCLKSRDKQVVALKGQGYHDNCREGALDVEEQNKERGSDTRGWSGRRTEAGESSLHLLVLSFSSHQLLSAQY